MKSIKWSVPRVEVESNNVWKEVKLLVVVVVGSGLVWRAISGRLRLMEEEEELTEKCKCKERV